MTTELCKVGLLSPELVVELTELFMTEKRGWLCMNEIAYGSDLTPPMMGLVRTKMDPHTFRKTILEGHRWTGPEAVKVGLADALGGHPEVLKLIADKKLVGKGKGKVYGLLRDEMYREVLALGERYGKGGLEHRADLVQEGRPHWSKL